MIETYDFGQVTIDGCRYSRDVIIFPSNVKDGWWRKEGHRLSLGDLKDIFEAKPEVLVIGTGYCGLMKVPQDVRDHVKSRNIELVVENTKQACETYNRLCQSRKVVAAFHLTC
ncbi:MAG: Mth938-like domain-containing protein [Candidatus Bathyarchaeota archaeon]